MMHLTINFLFHTAYFILKYMPMKLLAHSLIIIGGFGFIFLLELFFHAYQVQLLGFMVLLYLLFLFFGKKKQYAETNYKNNFEVFLLIIIIMLIISATGGISSLAFFLLYFLPFRIIFLFEPRSLLAFIAGSLLFFLPELNQNHTTESFIKLGSIIFITPIAYFFGQTFIDDERKSEEIEAIRDRDMETGRVITENVENILTDQQNIAETKDTVILKRILEEAQTLREEKNEEYI